jgi:hypothetical protein
MMVDHGRIMEIDAFGYLARTISRMLWLNASGVKVEATILLPRDCSRAKSGRVTRAQLDRRNELRRVRYRKNSKPFIDAVVKWKRNHCRSANRAARSCLQ